jgi:D-alanyl-D-alanine carboxypeptidase
VVLKLAEKGLLHLDDPLARWLPQFPRASRITIRELLNHTSGVLT